MAWSAEQLQKMDEYEIKYKSLTGKDISSSKLNSDETAHPTWDFVWFLESALFQLEKKNKELKEGK